jgi:maltooligosyltrehalose trehalohydrolase
MRRRHAMPFGAALDDGGRARFGLWAPGARSVELELAHDDGRASMAMAPQPGGWFALELDAIGANARYRFRIDDRLSVSDPASRSNPDDVHDPSALVNPCAFDWPDDGWRGRPWEEAAIYELHIGTFTPEGTFRAAAARMDYLADLGVTAIELMPVAEFAGRRNWGYDGVLPFAPDASYGTPDDLKALVAAAHARGLMVLMDVVYNHFGPEGNYLAEYAPQFFDPGRRTPWGAAINFRERAVRDFFIHNALYWVEEFHCDGLRLDAVHAIDDGSPVHIVDEISAALAGGPGQERHVHVLLENEDNQARFLEPRDGGHARAQWNDDFHHAVHTLATGERDGYYADYVEKPAHALGRALAEGFIYQGEHSAYRGGKPRGEVSAHLPPVAFVNFLQSHDQVGNRALGERIERIADPAILRASLACLLLSPAVPMLFMGEEFGASAPFLYFCDFGPDLAAAVREGRRAEFGRFARFRDPEAQAAIPDPGAETTFLASKLDWEELGVPSHAEWHALYRELLHLRQARVVPHIAGDAYAARYRSDCGRLRVDWTLGDGTGLHLRANLAPQPWPRPTRPKGDLLYATPGATRGSLPAWGVLWTLEASFG